MKKLHFIFRKNTHLSNYHLKNWIANDLITYEFHEDDSKLYSRSIWINKYILFWTADEEYNGIGTNVNDIKCTYKIMMNLVLPGTFPSFYWSRDENQLNRFINDNKYLNYLERKQDTIFLGSIKDEYQGSFRDPNIWKDYIDEFECKTGGEKNYKYDQLGYYNALANTRYGLCLRGGGPKCWRDIEYLALGCVLLVTPGVDVKNYHNPLEENKHYIIINRPDEIREKISKITAEQWNIMSNDCKKWYKENCHYEGSIKVLEDIIYNKCT
jgi:hypothetical protein